VGDDHIIRLRESIQRFIITDVTNPGPHISERDIPVLVEWPDNHGDVRGGNVLFFDGSARWLDYPSTFPMTEEAMAILTELAGRGPIRPANQPPPKSRLDALLEAGNTSSRR